MAGKRGPARAAGPMSFTVPAVLLGGLLAAASSWACDAVPADGCPTAPFRSAELFLDNHLKPVFIDSRLIWHWRWTTAAAVRAAARPGSRSRGPVELERRTLLDDPLPRLVATTGGSSWLGPSDEPPRGILKP